MIVFSCDFLTPKGINEQRRAFHNECMYVYMSVYTVYVAYLLFISQELIQSIVLSFFFENIHLEKLLTCPSSLSLSVQLRSLFVVPQWVQCNDPACARVSWRPSFILGVPVAASPDTSCVAPGKCPAGMAVGRGALDTWDPRPQGAEHPHPLRKASTTPLGPGTWDCSILLAMSVFWGRKTQQALLNKNRSRFNWNEGTFLVVQNLNQHWTSFFFFSLPHLMLIIWKMCKISGFLQLVVIQECNKALPSLRSPPK